jgi:tRNA U34 5-carboxymethylaminomethyl modifying GTPase MnmE/TrmE
LNNALKFLGQITGEITTEDILSQIFSTFWIGK